VLAKYGITQDEAAVKNAQSVIDFIRLKQGKLQVPLDQNRFIFRSNEGDYVTTMPLSKGLLVGPYKGAELSLGTKGSRESIEIKFGTAWGEKTKTKNLVFTIPITLPQPPDVTKPWRTPKNAKIQGPTKRDSSRNNLVRPGRNQPKPK